jgi:hypothetical protein
MSIKNSNDTIGNRSRNLPVCNAVPQPLRHRVPQVFILYSVINVKKDLQIVSKQETTGVTNRIADNIKILYKKDPKMQPCRTPSFMEYEWEIKNSSKSNSGLSAGKMASKPINMIKRA